MKLWSHVLVHLDAQQETSSVLASSLRVAEAFCGQVTAFDCVSAPGDALLLGGASSSSSVEQLAQQATRTRAAQMREQIAALEARVPVDVTIGSGTPERALLSCAARSEAGLIVKATSAADLRRMSASGRGAMHLLRASPVPVWLHAARPRGGPIVAVLNLSGAAAAQRKLDEDVLLAASRLSLVEKSELHLVCVADSARDRLFAGLMRPAQYRRYLAEGRRALRQSLESLITGLGSHAVPHLIEGDAEQALPRIVSALGADVVVLGRDNAASRGGLLGGGALAECLLYRAERSVLLVAPERRLASARTISLREHGQPGETHG